MGQWVMGHGSDGSHKWMGQMGQDGSMGHDGDLIRNVDELYLFTCINSSFKFNNRKFKW